MPKNYKAFTLAESLIVIIIVGILYTAILNIFKSDDLNRQVLQKAGSNSYMQLDNAFKIIIMKNTTNNNLITATALDGTKFSIVDDDAESKLSALLKRYTKALRNVSVNATYLDTKLKDAAGTTIDIKPSAFSGGFILNNKNYVAIKLNNACNVTESNLYQPMATNTRTQKNCCGTLFIDVNGDSDPNVLGIDQYIVPIGKFGLK